MTLLYGRWALKSQKRRFPTRAAWQTHHAAAWLRASFPDWGEQAAQAVEDKVSSLTNPPPSPRARFCVNSSRIVVAP
jgi:hypothetical protein